MDQLGIMNDPLIDRYYPYLICFDFEAMHEKTDAFDDIDAQLEVEINDSKCPGKTRFITVHRPISVSLCSNVPGHLEPIHIVNGVSEKQLVHDMIEAMIEIQKTAASIMEKEMEGVLNTLTNVKERVLTQSDTLSYSRKSHQWEDNSFSNIESSVKAFFDDYTEAGKKRKATSSIDRMPRNSDGYVN